MPYRSVFDKETLSYNVEDFLFHVGLHSIFYDKKPYDSRRKYKNINLETPLYAERFLAVVDEQLWNMLSCVSPSYNLITNEWALDKGHEVSEHVFHAPKGDSPWFRYGYLTKYRAACRMYLVITKTLQIKDVNHTWYGLIEIVNSYDKSTSLEFNVGFMMETMNNSRIPMGLLIPSLSLHFSANHLWTLTTIEKKLDQALDKEFQGRNVIQEFEKMVDKLLNIEVVDDEILPLFCKLARIGKLDASKEHDRNLAHEVIKIENDSKEWIEKCGTNAYAALCAYASFVSQKPENNTFLPEPTEFQSQLGRFVDDLIHASNESDFSMYDFIGKHAMEVKKQIKLICSKKQPSLSL